MTSIEFIYQGNITEIQSNLNDKMKDIINKYIMKSLIDKNSIMFLYSGNKINEELKLSDIIGKEEKDKIKILVYSKDSNNNNNTIKKSKYIICPDCGENIKYRINNYKIYLYECKNLHRINSILFNEFDNTQNIDILKIICEKCKEKNKSNTYNNELFKCLTCGINLCPLCKSSHDKTHNIINYDQKNYLCEKHQEIFIKYCNECKMNICLICENEHKGHNTIAYADMLPNEIEIKEYINKLRKAIDILKNNIEEIKNKMDEVKKNIEIFYNINSYIINNYNIKYRNYEILQNIKEINNNKILDEINKINDDNNINNKINNIINIYNKMVIKDLSEMNIIYDINKKDKKVETEKDTIKIFGLKFVNNNKNICKMVIDNKEYELKEKYNIKNYNNNIFKIKLTGIDNIKNMSYIFDGSSSLLSLPDISKWNTNNATDMGGLLDGCSSLSSLPDISNWNTNNVTRMFGMFKECSFIIIFFTRYFKMEY